MGPLCGTIVKIEQFATGGTKFVETDHGLRLESVKMKWDGEHPLPFEH